jgi:hypothetical protein
MGSIALMIEEQGIPTVTLYNERHEKRFMGTILLEGYVDYPAVNFEEYDTFTVEGVKNLAPQAFDFLVKGLTTWEPEYMQLQGEKWVPKESEFTYQADTYQESLEEFNHSYLEMGWGDGLPMKPPTRQRVDALMEGTPLSPDTVLGKWGPSSADFTVEKVAIAAAMAGAEPQHMPVIVAALKAITSNPWDAYSPVIRSPVPLMIVNGPYAEEIGINSAANAFGPHPKYSANGLIGRAVNLAMTCIPGNGRGLLPSNLAGNPGSYAGIVIAEAEDVASLAEGWDPLSTQLGYPDGTNLVTVLGVNQMNMSVTGSIEDLAAFVAPDKSSMIWPRNREAWESRRAGALIITEMNSVTEGLMGGKTKADITHELWEKARVPVDTYSKKISRGMEGMPAMPTDFHKSFLKNPEFIKKGVPVAAGPENFLTIVTGGH